MSDVLTISLREARLILERLVQAGGCPPGLLIAAREAALAAALSAPDGFERLEDWLAEFRRSAPAAIAPPPRGAGAVIACGGQHAFYCAQAVLDLAVDADRRGEGVVVAVDIGAPSAFAGTRVLAEAHRMIATLTPEAGGVRIDLSPAPADAPTRLDLMRRDGAPVPAATWWRLYEASKDALAPDSFESRRHAGTVRVEADGTLVGRNDEDETDLSMLTADIAMIRPAARPTPAQGHDNAD